MGLGDRLLGLAARIASNDQATTSCAGCARPFVTSLAAQIRSYPTPIRRPKPGTSEKDAEAAASVAQTASDGEAAVQPQAEPYVPEEPKEDLVRQALGWDVMSNSEVMRQRLTQTRLDYQRAPGDTGSTEVQVALLTEKISNLAGHMRLHRKDFNTRRGLQGMLNRRRKLLQYLRRSDFEAYTVLLVRLGLKDNYAKLIGLNMADVFTVLGLYAAAPKEDLVPGLEFAGIVEELGPPLDQLQQQAAAGSGPGSEAAELRPGDRVYGVTRFGAFADRLNIKAEYLQPVPEGWSFPQAAAFLVQGLTAMYGLRAQGSLQRGHTVLIHSAAGGCGQFAMEICRAAGALPVATVGSAAKIPFLLQRFPWLKEECIIVRDASRFGEQLAAALAALGAEGFDVILDAVSGEFFQPGFDALAPGGRYVIYGAANWTPTGDRPGWLRLAWQYLQRPRLDPLAMIGQNRSVMGFNLIHLYSRAPLLRRWLRELQDLRLPPPTVAKIYGFEEAPAALRFLQTGSATGKVVLSLEEAAH